MAIGDLQLPVTVTPFPPGTCFQSDQDLANAVANAIQVTFPGTQTPWNIGPNQPSVNDRDKPWLKLDATTNTIVGIFSWSPFYGLWLQNHWLFNGQTPPTDERRIFVDTLLALETYDGGEGGTISATTGPFWVQDTAFNDAMAVGSNTFAAVPGTLYKTSATTSGTAPPTNIGAVGVYFIKPSGRIFDRGA